MTKNIPLSKIKHQSVTLAFLIKSSSRREDLSFLGQRVFLRPSVACVCMCVHLWNAHLSY